jgi:hypothetical protein
MWSAVNKNGYTIGAVDQNSLGTTEITREGRVQYVYASCHHKAEYTNELQLLTSLWRPFEGGFMIT